MVCLYIYIGFSFLTFLMVLMQSYVISKHLKRNYPELIKELRKKKPKDVLENIFDYIKILITCFIPIINIGIFYLVLFKGEIIEEQTIQKLTK